MSLWYIMYIQPLHELVLEKTLEDITRETDQCEVG